MLVLRIQPRLFFLCTCELYYVPFRISVDFYCKPVGGRGGGRGGAGVGGGARGRGIECILYGYS
jgi:hypothetical protein